MRSLASTAPVNPAVPIDLFLQSLTVAHKRARVCALTKQRATAISCHGADTLFIPNHDYSAAKSLLSFAKDANVGLDAEEAFRHGYACFEGGYELDVKRSIGGDGCDSERIGLEALG